MEAEAPETFDLGDLLGLTDGSMRCFEDAGEFGVVVCRVRGTLYALEDNCSHADAPLSEGRLRGHTLTCALHGAQFDVRDGSSAGPPALWGVATFGVDASEGTARLHLGRATPDTPSHQEATQ